MYAEIDSLRLPESKVTGSRKHSTYYFRACDSHQHFLFCIGSSLLLIFKYSIKLHLVAEIRKFLGCVYLGHGKNVFLMSQAHKSSMYGSSGRSIMCKSNNAIIVGPTFQKLSFRQVLCWHGDYDEHSPLGLG